MTMDSESSVMRSARSFFAGTLLSRVMGLARDVAMAFCFGSTPEVAAFMVAYRLANLFRRLLGEGNLQGGFVLQFEHLRLQGGSESALFYRDIFFSMILSVAALIGASAAGCWVLNYYLNSDILLMMLLMMPGVIFLCLYALNSSVLQCQRRYFLPAMAPVAFNAIWIIAAFLFHGQPIGSAMFSLSVGVLIAFAMQWWLTSRPVIRWVIQTVGWREWLRPQIFSTHVRAIVKPLSLGIVGIGAAQINSALDAIFARIADPVGPAYLWYSIRIQQLPLALFGIAIAGALLPPLSRAMQSGSLDRYRELLQGGLKQSAALMFPCTMGMIVLATAGLDLLYGHGGFHSADVQETALCLQCYAVGLIPMVYVLLLANGFYAQKEYHWPMRCSLVAVACNTLLNVIFVFWFHWGAASIALATSISAYLNCSMLFYGLKKKVGGIILWRNNGRIILCSLAAAAAAGCVDGWLMHKSDFLSQMSRFIAASGVFGGTVLVVARYLKIQEIMQLVRWRKSPAQNNSGA